MEINHTCISHCLDRDREIREKLIGDIEADISKAKPSGLILHGPFTEIHPAAIDYKIRDLGMARLNEAYEVAAHFSVKKMVVHTGWVPLVYFKNWQEEQSALFWNKFLEDKPEDFRISVENVMEDEPYMLKSMIERADNPRIGLCLDVGHAQVVTDRSISIEKWIEVLSPYISHFHLHNNDGTADSHRAFHLGTLDMKSILSAIDGFCREDVTLTIEAGDAASCLNWLKENRYI